MVSSRLEGVERVLLEQNPWFTNGVPSLFHISYAHVSLLHEPLETICEVPGSARVRSTT